MMEVPKLKPYRNADYLKFIRSKPCPYCLQQAEPHHIRRHWLGSGGSQKSHDYASVPRCRDHHGPDYEEGFEREIISLLMEYVESKR